MELTVTEACTLLMLGLVVVQGAVAVASSAVVVSLIVMKGWSWRYLAYLYLFGLMILYFQFLFFGPPIISLSAGNLLYWGLLLGTAPANMAPLFTEAGDLAELQRRKGRRRRLQKSLGLVIACIFSALLTGMICWMLAIYVSRLS